MRPRLNENLSMTAMHKAKINYILRIKLQALRLTMRAVIACVLSKLYSYHMYMYMKTHAQIHVHLHIYRYMYNVYTRVGSTCIYSRVNNMHGNDPSLLPPCCSLVPFVSMCVSDCFEFANFKDSKELNCFSCDN